MTAYRARTCLPRSLHPMYPLLPLLGVLAAHAGCSDGAPSLVATPTEVMTEYGPVRGSIGNGAVGYLGIPYAAPPTGNLRFAPPAAPTPWTDTLDADTRPRACPQVIPILGAQTEEDCLYINVHAPLEVPESGAPVLVWIHGGGFTLGEGVQTEGGTVGDILARDENIIVVSMNYRLGALGFLSHPALTDESADSISGNYGLLDQVAALEWVRDNIRAFGGDPERVTIAGQSAGGISVCARGCRRARASSTAPS
ncbi:MAG: carboxylesterase family protein [Sandaracinaceae bacterium]|nr:carboxylesterase family protein [Sandaracinaceae bacterium]